MCDYIPVLLLLVLCFHAAELCPKMLPHLKWAESILRKGMFPETIYSAKFKGTFN